MAIVGCRIWGYGARSSVAQNVFHSVLCHEMRQQNLLIRVFEHFHVRKRSHFLEPIAWKNQLGDTKFELIWHKSSHTLCTPDPTLNWWRSHQRKLSPKLSRHLLGEDLSSLSVVKWSLGKSESLEASLGLNVDSKKITHFQLLYNNSLLLT